jgi:lysophospholipase L1-like esterase
MLKPLLLAAALLAAPALAQAQTDPPPFKATKIVLVGDSTTAVNSGWGGAFCATRVTSNVACVNLGRGGRSTKTYRAEGSWTLALGEMKGGPFAETYVLIQFGHNDAYGRAERLTDLKTEFPANLKRYVEEARAAGARPVLVTPLSRRQFKDGKLVDDLVPWARAVRAVAAETGDAAGRPERPQRRGRPGLGTAEGRRLGRGAALARPGQGHRRRHDGRRQVLRAADPRRGARADGSAGGGAREPVEVRLHPPGPRGRGGVRGDRRGGTGEGGSGLGAEPGS